MILTCPECATSYFVDDSRVPAGGRTVKCTSCDARWRAMPEAAAPAATEPFDEPAEPEAAAPAAAVAAEVAEAAPEPEALPEDDIEIVAREEPEPRRRRPPPQPAPKKKSALGAVIAWSAMAAAVAAVVAGAIVFRDEVVKLAPQTSGAYAGLGLPVNELGLVIEQVKVEPTFQGGRPVLSVSGTVRNVGEHTAQTPPLRIDLLDKAGAPVAAKIARPIDARIPAGAKRYFAIAIIDPPANAKDLQVAFVAEEKAPPAAAHGSASEAHAEPTPTAVEARPLPADNPDALHDHG